VDNEQSLLNRLPDLEAEIRRLVDDLVSGRFGNLIADGRIGRLTEPEVRKAMDEYGARFIALPAGPILIPASGEREDQGGEWWIDVPLWSEEEVRSDLELRLTVCRTEAGFRVQIDDLLVP
jgi:hypothetical protein